MVLAAGTCRQREGGQVYYATRQTNVALVWFANVPCRDWWGPRRLG